MTQHPIPQRPAPRPLHTGIRPSKRFDWLEFALNAVGFLIGSIAVLIIGILVLGVIAVGIVFLLIVFAILTAN